MTHVTEVLDSLIADGEGEGFGTRYDTEILAALRELRALRHGEFICSRCQLREAQDQPHLQF